MSNLPTTRIGTPVPSASMTRPLTAFRTNRALGEISAGSLVRNALVNAEAQVASAKVAAAARVVQTATSASMALHHYGNVLANGDPVLREELRHYEHVYRAGVTDVLVDLFSDYCREGR